MNDCESFHQRLVGGLPYRVRNCVEYTLRSLHASEAMLHMLARAVDATAQSSSLENGTAVVVFGSFGRLDGHAEVSDFDMMCLYPGKPKNSTVQSLREIVRETIVTNKCLPFDHRDELESGAFDFDASPAYPILASDDLTTPAKRVRSLQLLTEGRAIRNPEHVHRVREKLLGSFGFTEMVGPLNLAPFRDALVEYRDSYCYGVIGRKSNSKWKLTNRKVLKLFALREFSYLANLFALAEVSLAVAIGRGTVDHSLQILSSPSVLKVASYGSSLGTLGDLFRRLSPAFCENLIAMVAADLNSIPERDRMVTADSTDDPSEGKFFALIRRFILPVLFKYDTLLHYLHDPKFIAFFDRLAPDVTTWLGHQAFLQLLKARGEMIEAMKQLARTLCQLLLAVAGAGFLTHDAQCSLEEIANYKLILNSAKA